MLKLAVLLLLSLFLFMAFIPAYAEVTSLYTDRNLYSIDMSIFFTGTVDSADSQKLVNLMIQDPNGKLVMMTGTFAQPNDTFQIVVNTNDQRQFYLKGAYSATAFIDSKSTGKTIYFDFSPDGSQVIHAATESQNESSSNVGNNMSPGSSASKHYDSILHESVQITGATNSSQKIPLPQDGSVLPSATYDVANILYPIMAVCGGGLVGFILYKRKKRQNNATEKSQQTVPTGDIADQDYAMMILKNRLAKGEISIDEFKATKDALGEP